jgi:SEC-C motif-containing protein
MSLATPDCPCGRVDARRRALGYAACCGRWIDHFPTHPAPDAETLMRSRYSAFVLEKGDYLLATWHASNRPMQLDFDPGVRWLGLEVRSFKTIDDAHAEVSFVARQRDAGGRAHRLQETSRFVREDGRWVYLDGDLA